MKRSFTFCGSSCRNLRGERSGKRNSEASQYRAKFSWKCYRNWAVEGTVETTERVQKNKAAIAYWVLNPNMFTWKPQEFELYPPMQIRVKKCLKEYEEVNFSLRYVFCQNRWWRRYERECLFKFCCCATIQREWYLKYGNWYSISLFHHLQVESRTEFMRHLVWDIWQLKDKSGILPLTERKHGGRVSHWTWSSD